MRELRSKTAVVIALACIISGFTAGEAFSQQEMTVNTTVRMDVNYDMASRVANITAGRTDGCYLPTVNAHMVYNGVTGPSGDGTLKSSDPNVKVWCGEPNYVTNTIGFNMNPTIIKLDADDPGVKENPFTIKEMRQAVSYSFNYSAAISDAAYGFGVQLQGIVPEGMLGHHGDLFMYDYNLTAAQEAWNSQEQIHLHQDRRGHALRRHVGFGSVHFGRIPVRTGWQDAAADRRRSQ